MVKMDILDYGIYCNGEHFADSDKVDLAKKMAVEIAKEEESDVVIINNFTGEVIAIYEVKFRLEIIEVEP